MGTYHSLKASRLANIALRIDMKKWLFGIIIFQLLASNMAFAQQEEDIMKNTQNDILIVAAAGAGGAVLGLSTLSFYETPSPHISNVWTGAAMGIIAGVIFVAYSSAQKGSEELQGSVPSEGFSTSERVVWHAEKSESLTMKSVQFGTQIWETTF
jgi:hypothetical protein